MAKISAERVYLTTNDGRSLDFKRELHVDKDGIFKLSVPYELYNSLPEGVATNNKQIQRTKVNTKYFLVDKTLKDCENLFKEAVTYWENCEAKEKFFLMYHTDTKYTFYEKDGIPSLFGKYEDMKGTRISSSWDKVMMLKLQVAICKEVTYTTATTSQTSTERLEYTDYKKLSESGKLLYDSAPMVDISETHFHNGWRKLDLTEENAKFFYNALLTIGMLADKIKNLFSDAKQLEAKITSGSGIKLLEY